MLIKSIVNTVLIILVSMVQSCDFAELFPPDKANIYWDRSMDPAELRNNLEEAFTVPRIEQIDIGEVFNIYYGNYSLYEHHYLKGETVCMSHVFEADTLRFKYFIEDRLKEQHAIAYNRIYQIIVFYSEYYNGHTMIIDYKIDSEDGPRFWTEY